MYKFLCNALNSAIFTHTVSFEAYITQTNTVYFSCLTVARDTATAATLFRVGLAIIKL